MFRKSTKTHDPVVTSDDQVQVAEAAPCQKSVKVRVSPKTLAPIRDTVLAEFTRQAALPGFRKGKAPTDLVKRQYGQQIQDETLHRATKQAFEGATKAHDLKPVGPFEVSKADFTEQHGLTLEALVEVEPMFTLAPHKEIPLKELSAAVTPDDVQQAMSKLQDSMAQLVPGKEGEDKQRQVPPLDDELAKDLGLKDLPALREHVEAKLLEQRKAAQAQALEASLCDELLTRNTFHVPAKLVQHQAERLTRDFKTRLLLSGMAEEQAAQELTKFTDQLRTSAERQVKLIFILDRVAERESIQATQDELVSRLWQVSQQWKKDPAEVRKIFDAQGLWSSVLSTIRQEKTIAWLLGQAAIERAATPLAAGEAAAAPAAAVAKKTS